MKLKQGAFSMKYNSSSQLNRSSLKDLSKEKNKENHSSNTLLHVSDIINTLDEQSSEFHNTLDHKAKREKRSVSIRTTQKYDSKMKM